MHRPQASSLNPHSNAYGFSLLEMVLSTGLAGLIILAMTASLAHFNQHKLLAQVLVQAQSQHQLAVAQLLTDWQSLCDVGVVSGSAHTIALRRPYQGGCMRYDYGYSAVTKSLTRRREGGRHSGFLAQVESVVLYFGVDTTNNCRVDQWRRSYAAHPRLKLHQVRIQLQLRIAASRQLRAGKTSSWLWHADDEVVLHPVNFIWRLAHVCV